MACHHIEHLRLESIPGSLREGTGNVVVLAVHDDVENSVEFSSAVVIWQSEGITSVVTADVSSVVLVLVVKRLHEVADIVDEQPHRVGAGYIGIARVQIVDVGVYVISQVFISIIINRQPLHEGFHACGYISSLVCGFKVRDAASLVEVGGLLKVVI